MCEGNAAYHYVVVKSAEHQARAVAFRTHQCFVRQRTQLINGLRGHLGEFGIVIAQGPANLNAQALSGIGSAARCSTRTLGVQNVSSSALLMT